MRTHFLPHGHRRLMARGDEGGGEEAGAVQQGGTAAAMSLGGGWKLLTPKERLLAQSIE